MSNRSRRTISSVIVLAAALLGTACSTTQEVTVTKAAAKKPIASVAQVLDADNSAQMNGHLLGSLQKEGLVVKPSLPAGTRTAQGVDALISYVDVWRWDFAMYLRNLTIRLVDAQTGDLIAFGQWAESAMHGYRDAKGVVEGLVAEVIGKARAATMAAAQ